MTPINNDVTRQTLPNSQPTHSSPPADGLRQPRPYGLAAGEFIVPDDFDDPLPDEILALFEEEI